MDNGKNIVIKVEDLTVSFRTNHGLVRAVRGVNFELYQGETLAVVGESGSGKSVSSRSIMGILAGNAIVEKGHIYYEGQDLLKIHEDDFHKIRGNKIGMIFQDPTSALNPIMRVGKQITEAMILNGKRKKNKFNALFHAESVKVRNTKLKIEELKNKKPEGYQNEVKELKTLLKEQQKELKVKKAEAKVVIDKEYDAYKVEYKEKLAQLKNNFSISKKDDKKVSIKEFLEKKFELKEEYQQKIKVTAHEAKLEAYKIMEEVGIPEPEKRFKSYPFQFSGGMKQRIVIAIALMAQPEVLICDEPTTALDVTIQAQILDLLKDLKKRRNLSLIFITHNLGVVANVADRVAVMYAGKVVEYGLLDDIFYNPRHPYTWALMNSMPDINSKEKLNTIPGTPPNMLYPPKGDAFAVRNQYAMKIDYEEQPPLFKVSDTHYAATWLLHPDAPQIDIPDSIKQRIANMKEETERLRSKS